MWKRKNKAQSILDYTAIIIVCATALFAMKRYFVNSVQERYRQSGDVFGDGEQYVPGGVTVVTNVDSPGASLPPVPVPALDACAHVQYQVAQKLRDLNGFNLSDGRHIMGLYEQIALNSNNTGNQSSLGRYSNADGSLSNISIVGNVSTTRDTGNIDNTTGSLGNSTRYLNTTGMTLTEKRDAAENFIDERRLEFPECF